MFLQLKNESQDEGEREARSYIRACVDPVWLSKRYTDDEIGMCTEIFVSTEIFLYFTTFKKSFVFHSGEFVAKINNLET
jgi:hypothetical protein